MSHKSLHHLQKYQLLILLLSIAFTILLRIIAFVMVKDLQDDFIFLVTIFLLLNQSLDLLTV